MSDAFIVAAARTPVGRRGGGLSDVHPVDLASELFTALLERSGVDGARVDDVIMGCVNQVGAQASNVARNAWLAAGLPVEVPGTTLDRQCGSSQQAVHFAAQAVMSGAQELVLAGGVEVMSKVPIGASKKVGEGLDFGDPYTASHWAARYGPHGHSQFEGAELIAKKWGLTREALERFALESHERAIAAAKDGKFDEEVVPIHGVTADEGPRADTSREKMATLKPLLEGGVLTAAAASQISDGASAVLVASEQAVREHGLQPLVNVRATTVVGSDPELMLTGPITATQLVLKRAGLALEDVGRFEINEAFASVVLAWLAETGADPSKTNVDGGAIALGHPLGATGTRLMTTLIHEMRRTETQFGLQSMCEGGGMANATVLELV